jgi:hypothetical protein
MKTTEKINVILKAVGGRKEMLPRLKEQFESEIAQVKQSSFSDKIKGMYISLYQRDIDIINSLLS